MQTLLTIDLGTTSFKCGLFDAGGRMLAHVRVTPPVRHPRPGRWELPVDDLIAAVQQGVRRLGRAAPSALRRAAAVCFATQTNSFALLDGRDRALTPLILWPDLRAADGSRAQVALAERIAALRDLTGVPGMTAESMLAKLLWLKRQTPDLWRRTTRVALIGDYLAWWLSGAWTTEGGAQSLTGLCDTGRWRWIPEAIQSLDLPPEWLPPLVRAGTDLGLLRPACAEALGLPPACRVIAGTLDQHAGAIGVGNVRAGGCSETTGTVLAVIRCATAKTACPPGVFQGPAWRRDRRYRMIFGVCAAGLLERYRATAAPRRTFAALDALAAAVAPGADGLRLRDVSGAGDVLTFTGGSGASDTAHHVRCLLEAVAVALHRQVAALAAGQPPATIHCAGGGARSDLWLQIKADVLGCPTVASACLEPTSLGAALLAAHGLGWGRLPALAEAWARARRTFEPDAGRHARYVAAYGLQP